MTVSQRAKREIDHGKSLAQNNPELIWGWDTPAGRLRAERRAELIATGAGLKPGMHILEIGCGTGIFTEMFARTGAKIVAVDISPDLLEQAWERGLPAEQVTFLEKRFEACDVDGPFDAVIGSSVLHHLEIVPALAKIHNLLKPGGMMSFGEPNMLNPQIMLQKNIPWMKQRLGDSPDETAFIRWQLRALLLKTGFDKVEIIPLDWLHPATPKPLINLVRSVGRFLEKTPLLREFSGSVYVFARRPLLR